ncbi:uncharacterized protein Hyls1 [Drosophila pseudoobscura]|uniref:Uncharacterized protein Hyls1 n=1 Tax=Drosophila pseudoobscura pseudoobscura TaxID=46245 RepID=B5DIT7_DROPS|nr:uncharacterized protein LOC6903118 [Drosophila pseudoobscura]
MSHLPLDARAILQHLNDLGYRNISAEQLREFLKDLRKLIKYEERLAEGPKDDNFSRLHKRGTVSSRAKLGGENDKDKDKENAAPASTIEATAGKEKNSKTDESETRLAGGIAMSEIARLFRDKLFLGSSKPGPDASQSSTPVQSSAPLSKRRSRSKTRKAAQNAPFLSSGESEANLDHPMTRRHRGSKSRPRSSSLGASLVRRRAKSKKEGRMTDPVALYQYYQNEWAYFREQIPGTNAHKNARSSVRHKLMVPKP